VTAPNPERRSERARQAILTAAIELCREQGYAGTTMEGIAKRAEVGKQTIYRWWPSKAAVIQEALNERASTSTDFPDTGDIVADLCTQMTSVVKLLTSAEFVPYAGGLIAAAQTDPAVAKSVVETMIEPRVRACKERLERARQQRQLRSDVDLDDVIELLYAPLYYRLLLHTRPITTQQVPDILDLAFDGLRPRSPKPKTRRPRT
jgi:AcrR family transcriptional regulator